MTPFEAARRCAGESAAVGTSDDTGTRVCTAGDPEVECCGDIDAMAAWWVEAGA